MVVANVKVRLYNVYGTTEGTVYQMSQRLLPSVDTPPTCIGLPMPGITVAVVHLPMHDDVDDASLAQFNLPAALELVKPGELGELMVGGVQTARGYQGVKAQKRRRRCLSASSIGGETEIGSRRLPCSTQLARGQAPE